MEEHDNSVLGENDKWILFDRATNEGYPLVVFARSGNPVVTDALNKGVLTTVVCEAEIGLVNDLGMPQHTDRLYPIEEGLAQELQAFDVGAFHVASVTGDGMRRMIYVHESPLNFEPILGLFSPEGYRLSVGLSDERQAVIDLVTPTAIELHLDSDLGVISNLEKNGDEGVLPRRTDFWFYGETRRLTGVAEELAAWGYAVDRWLDDPQGVVLHRDMSVNFATFREVTPLLIGAAERHSVTYDGWETFVVQSGANARNPSDHEKKQSFLHRLFGPKKS